MRGERSQKTRRSSFEPPPFGHTPKRLDKVEPWHGRQKATGPRPIRELRRRDQLPDGSRATRPDTTGQRTASSPGERTIGQSSTRRPYNRQRDTGDHPVPRREPETVEKAQVYRRRRLAASSVVILGILVLIFAAFTQTSGVESNPLPIDPNSASPATVLATVSEVQISPPIRPVSLNAIAYHPGGEDLLKLEPRGKNLSNGLLPNIPGVGSTPEKINYQIMDPAGRSGPKTGAVDAGADAGTPVYAPVAGVVTDIRPDPAVQGADIVEIKPEKDSNFRVRVSPVRDISGGVAPRAPVTAGMTEIGRVADSRRDPQAATRLLHQRVRKHVTVSVVPASTTD